MAVVSALNDDGFRLYNYHVFLSFRGEGTDKSFTDDLYKALVGEGFRTFRHDAEIEKGEEIRSELEKTIKQSMISIIVLSKDYTSSFWCLDELATIVECKKKFGQVVLPVFYDVSPSQVRKQKGSISKAFAYYELEQFKLKTDGERKRGWKYKVEGWNEALREVSRMFPRVLQNQADGHESKLIQKTVEEIEDKVKAVRKDFVSMRAETEVELWNQIINCAPSLSFESMNVLQVLDLSNTSINSLPSSISRLFTLRVFYLRGCELLMELPPEIGALRNLKVFDLEGTEVICLPKEIGGLLKLECLKVSLYGYADQYRESKGIDAIIPRATLSKFSHLKELSIDVDPDCGWWDVEVEAIINELSNLGNLETLKLYLPTVELLQQFLQLPRNMYMMYPTLSNFRLIVGRHEQRIISHLPHDLQDNFEKLNRCLKYVNSEGDNDRIAEALKQATALFLDRHWTIDRLSAFKIDEMDKLNFCLLVECNEMKIIVDGGEFYQQGDKNYGEKPILRSLQYLSIHYMKNLESIWKGPIVTGCLSYLNILALHTCPKLSTIFNLGLLGNLVNLKELIVEDCPEIKSLVSLESSSLEYNHFLLNLKNISLLHLPELVSIASGLCIAPKLERMIIYNCPKLKSLSTIEMSSEDMKEIKGENAWWEALEWHRSEWSSDRTDYLDNVFVPLGSDDDLMDQLAEAVETSLTSQVHSLETCHDFSSTASEVESFQKQVFSRFHDLSTATADEFLSLAWIRKLLDAFICCQEEFSVILGNNSAQLSKPPLDGLVSELLLRSVNALDICNATREGIEKIRLWHKHLEIVLGSFESLQENIGEGLFCRVRKALMGLALVMMDEEETGCSVVSHGNLAVGPCNKRQQETPISPRNLKRSLSPWSVHEQLQSIANNLVPPFENKIAATNGLAISVFTMSFVLVFVLWVLVAAIPCQDRGPLQVHFSIPRQFSWGTPLYLILVRIMDESKKHQDSTGLLKEIYQIEKCAIRMTGLLASTPFLPGEEEVTERVQELSLVCDVCKHELDPLEHQIRRVFREIISFRTSGLNLLGEYTNPSKPINRINSDSFDWFRSIYTKYGSIVV